MRKAIFITGLMAALPAWSCNQGDLTGRWNLFYEDFSCLMTVQPDGRVTAGQCLQLAEDPDRAGNRDAVRGRLKVQADCRVTGDLGALHGIVYVARGEGSGIDIGSPETFSGDYANFSAVLVD